MKGNSLNIVWLAMLLISCATPGEMRSTTAAGVYESKRSAKEVAICIADRWENSGWFNTTVPVNMRPTKTGYTASLRNDGLGHTQLLVDVEDVGSGSKTKYFKNLVIGEGTFDLAVTNCQ